MMTAAIQSQEGALEQNRQTQQTQPWREAVTSVGIAEEPQEANHNIWATNRQLALAGIKSNTRLEGSTERTPLLITVGRMP